MSQRSRSNQVAAKHYEFKMNSILPRVINISELKVINAHVPD